MVLDRLGFPVTSGERYVVAGIVRESGSEYVLLSLGPHGNRIRVRPVDVVAIDRMAPVAYVDQQVATALNVAVATFQPLNAALSAISTLPISADKIAFFTSATTAAIATLTAFARTLIADANAGAARTTLGLGTVATESTVPIAKGGTGAATAVDARGNLGAAASGLATASGLMTAATNTLLGRKSAGGGAVEELVCTAAARDLLDDADAAAMRATLGLVIGTQVQAYDAELAALAGLVSAADRLPYFTGSGTAALATFTAAARALLDDADAAAMRATLEIESTPRTLHATLDSTEVASSTADTALVSYTVPGGTMGARGGLLVEVRGWIYNNTAGSVTYTLRAKWAGTTVWGDAFGLAAGTARKPFHLRVLVQNLNNASKQSVIGLATVHAGAAAGTVAGVGNWGATDPINSFGHDPASYPAANTASNQTVELSLQIGTNNADARFKVDIATVKLEVLP